jgi:chromosome segregation protein
MLTLDRIEILGFKSFCDKTTLKIPSGITAIVGPNGCGKSNIVDAMYWVLGEQSAKTLRSDKMEEVIFNGSKNRKPLNMAQVSLIWKTMGDFPAGPEIVISRRLFRSGDSQYEMNGEICRLKDIHSFFLNEGFDPLAYSILEQGKIEFLFLSKPAERRNLIEEVAGVAEFKHKKRAAQFKLAENQLQLSRIGDILQEVEKQLSSLRRQAARARRYQVLQAEKGILQKIVFHRRFAQLQQEHSRLLQLLDLRVQEEERAILALQQADLVYNEKKLRFSEVESALYEEQGRLHQLEMQIQENQNLLQSKKQRIEDLRRGIQEKHDEISKFNEEEVGLCRTCELKIAEEADLRNQINAIVQQHTLLFSQLEQKSNEVELLEQRMQQQRKTILESLATASHYKNEQIRLHTQEDHLSETVRRKQSELELSRSMEAQLRESLSSKTAALDQITQEVGYLDETKTEILKRCSEFKVEWDQLQQQVQEVFRKRTEIQNELHKLDAQQHSSKFYNESARNLLAQPARVALGVMMDFIQTDPQFETAVENFLADKLNYLIVNEEASALASIDYLKQEEMGYCGFVIKNGHDVNPPVIDPELREEEGVVGSLREVVTIPDEVLPAIAPFMESAVLVNHLGIAQNLIKRYPNYQFVTVQGDVILSPNLYAGGSKSDDVPGLIAIQRRKRENAVALELVEHKIATLEHDVRDIQDQLYRSNRELVRLNDERDSKNKDLMMVQMQMDQLQKECNRETRLAEILSEEMQHSSAEQEALAARSEQFRIQLEEENRAREQCERDFAQAEQQSLAARQDQSQLQDRVSDSRIQIAELKERDRALLAEIDRFNNQKESITRSIHESAAMIVQKQEEISNTEVLCGQMEEKQTEQLRNRDQQKQRLQELQASKDQLTEELSACNNAVQDARRQLDVARNEKNSGEMEMIRVETQKDDLAVRCIEEMGIGIDSLSVPESALQQSGDEELKAQLAATEQKIERLGSINMLALQEYTEMEERHRFLKSQYDDLKVSIDTLLDTILRIDATSLQRFREAFQAVQENFQNLFQRLFGGGKCELVLIDPENPNESGIDIHVQPPGKRLQNMNLLSGGEKTLTGIAFLMALFQYHTSPFCVMDEVDAALDEINVQRFAALISEMKTGIQFVIVTHNKRTMEAADHLYGITMAEPGISNVLSARFEEAEALIQ